MVVKETHRDARSSTAPDREMMVGEGSGMISPVTPVVGGGRQNSSPPVIAGADCSNHCNNFTVGDRSVGVGVGGTEPGGEQKKHRLKSRFQVVKKLGQGTYGKVQLAINNETGQEVAIKTIKKSKIETEQDLVRIRREIQIMSSIQHPHIIRIYEVFENKEKIVLVMQYASGGELYEYVSERKILGDAEARRLFRQIATAIYYCHKNKVCHRDLKLENILLDDKGNAKIGDFGLSNIFDDKHHLNTFCGSPLYASPEIVKGTPYFGPEVDCWSMGVLLYTLVYGAMPFDGSNFKRLVKQISESNYYEPKNNKSKASALIRKLLTVDPKKRGAITDICNDGWVNEGYEHSLIQIAEDMATLSPVKLESVVSTPTTPNNNNNIDQSLVQKKPEVKPIRRLTIPIPAITEESKSEATTPTQTTQPQQVQQQHPAAETIPQSQTTTPPSKKTETQKPQPQQSKRKSPPVQQVKRPSPPKKVESSAPSPPRETLSSVSAHLPQEPSAKPETVQPEPEISSVITEQLVEKVPSSHHLQQASPSQHEITHPSPSTSFTQPQIQPEKEVKEVEPILETTSRKSPPKEPKVIHHPISFEPSSLQELPSPAPPREQERQVPSHQNSVESTQSTECSTPTDYCARKSRSVDDSDQDEKGARRSSSVARRVGRLSIPNPLFEDKSVPKTPVPRYGSIEDTKKKLLERRDSIDKDKERIFPTIPVQVAKEDVERRASIPEPFVIISHGPIAGQINRTGAKMKGQRSSEDSAGLNGHESPKNIITAVTLKLQQPSKSSSLTPEPPRFITSPMTPPLLSEESGMSSPTEDPPNIRYIVDEPSSSYNREQRTISSGVDDANHGDNTESEETDSLCSSSMEAPIAVRPVPITRSYKKTTFTKDGACVTETGKIISTTGPDGRVTTIERKSKITRYPASPNGDFGEDSPFRDINSSAVTSSHITTTTSSTIGPQHLNSPEHVAPAGPSASGSLLSVVSAGLSKSESISSSGSMDIFEDVFDSWHGDPIFANMGSMVKRIRNLLPSSHSSLLTRRCSPRLLPSDSGTLEPREEESFLPPVAVPESSSLLEQLRAHGYKNLVKQRMMTGGCPPEDVLHSFPDGEESVRERIHRKSFYRRFNEDPPVNQRERNGERTNGSGRYSRQSSVTRSVFPFDP